MTLIKEDDRVSEQTFAIALFFDDPAGFLTRPATLSQSQDSTVNFDYALVDGIVELEFRPNQTEVQVAFTLFPDELPEGTEGFSISIASLGGRFPNFQLPVTTSVTVPAFASTLVRILDNDCKFLRSVPTHCTIHYVG